MIRKLFQTVVFIYLFAVIAGCAGWRSVQTVETVEPPSSFLNSKFTGTFNDTQWWTVFQDTTLNRLMDELFDSNLSLEQSAARLDQFRANYAASRSSWFPSLTGQVKIQDNGDVGNIAPPNPMMQSNRYDVTLSTMYEVDLWGKLAANRQAVYEDLLAGEENHRAFVLSLSAQTVRAYHGIVALQLQLDLAKKTGQSYQAFLEMVQGRYERGVVSSLDVYQARINLAGARSREAQLAAGLASAEHALSILLGRYPQNGLLTGQKNLPSNLTPLSEGLPSELIQRRPDVRSAFHRMYAADRRWAEAVAIRFPSFSLTAQMGGGSDELKKALDPNAMVWNAIGNLVLPIFEGGRRKANADRTQAAYVEQVAGYKQSILNAFREVEDALVKGKEQLVIVSELEKQVRAAESSLDIATDRYLRGLATYLQVVNAQTAYFNAGSNLITACRDLIDSRISLVTALGGSWMEEFVN